jgi:hypothetical protein
MERLASGSVITDPYYPGDVKWWVGAVGDFNDDNAIDVLFQENSAYGGAMYLWLMCGPDKVGSQTDVQLRTSPCNRDNVSHPGCSAQALGQWQVVGPR